MDDIHTLIRAVNLELSPAFEDRLRALLIDKDRDWLVDQVVRLSLDAHSLREIDRRSEREAKAKARAERLERVRGLGSTRTESAASSPATAPPPGTR